MHIEIKNPDMDTGVNTVIGIVIDIEDIVQCTLHVPYEVNLKVL
jgi:hypothetical protein